jgi:hypothetical protein
MCVVVSKLRLLLLLLLQHQLVQLLLLKELLSRWRLSHLVQSGRGSAISCGRTHPVGVQTVKWNAEPCLQVLLFLHVLLVNDLLILLHLELVNLLKLLEILRSWSQLGYQSWMHS